MGMLQSAGVRRKCDLVCISGSAQLVAGVSRGSSLPGPLRAEPKRDSDLMPIT